jgi:phosphoglycerate dehydrogenase-like enzyme
LSARPTVLLWLDQPEPYLRAAEAAGLAGHVDLVSTKLADDPSDEVLARADALLAWRPPARLTERAPRLRWVQSLTAGVEQWLTARIRDDVVLTCARGTHRLSMPENILGALFLLAKQLGPIVLDQHERRWRRRINDTLAGKTLGILGIGAIGTELARKAEALEMRVVGTRRGGTPAAHVERVFPPERTDDVLAQSDYVVLLLPSTSQTRGIIGARTLAMMKPTAYVLNFGRGDLVVDDDLVQAVRERRIAGAVLDVYTTEPLPATHPFWTTEGIVVLPHVGGLHPQRDSLVAALWVDNLAAFLAGRALREVVDPARGY